jgi:hypothetical protein
MLYFRATRAFWPTRVHVTLPDTQFLTTSEILRFQARNPVTGDMMRRCNASVLLRVLQAPGGYNIERIGVPR